MTKESYTNEVVINALKAVEDGKLPVEVARHFNIPIGTIQSWMRKGRGPQLYGKVVSVPENMRKRRRKTRAKVRKNPAKTVTASATIAPKMPRIIDAEVEFLRALVLRLAAALAVK